MFASLISGIKGLFSLSGASDVALKLVDKVAGTDWTASEKAEWILKYQEATKHQSPMRRIIAASITGVWLLVTLTWLVSTICGNLLYDDSLNSCLALAKELEEYLKENITETYNYVIMFYFGTALISKLKSS